MKDAQEAQLGVAGVLHAVDLPPRQVHCVENTGDSELRLLGVFHPSGSPAVRYPATPR